MYGWKPSRPPPRGSHAASPRSVGAMSATFPQGLPPGTSRVLALRASQTATADDLVRWALSALEGSWDSPALRILAGINLRERPSIWDTEPYFARALSELAIPVPDFETLVRQYVDELARDIADGRIAPQTGADLIHRVAIGPLSHPADLQPWCYLWEGNDPVALVPMEKSQVDDAIRAFARAWVRDRT